MKVGNFSSEQNGISLAVDVGEARPIYVTPSQFRGLLARFEALKTDFGTIPEATLDAIDERASMTPESRKLARVTAQRTKLEAAVAAAAVGTPARAVAEMELQLFTLKNS